MERVRPGVRVLAPIATSLGASCVALLVFGLAAHAVLGGRHASNVLDAVQLVGVIAFAIGTPIFSIVGWRSARGNPFYAVANIALLVLWGLLLVLMLFVHI